MPNGKDILNEMELEHRLQEMGDDQLALLKFVARQQYQMSLLCPVHDRRLRKLESRGRKELGAIGGLGALFGTAIAATIDFLMRR